MKIVDDVYTYLCVYNTDKNEVLAIIEIPELSEDKLEDLDVVKRTPGIKIVTVNTEIASPEFVEKLALAVLKRKEG